jgi:hypothetical protein
MLEFINSLEKYFNINKVGGEKNFQTNKNKSSKYNDTQVIVNYVNNINQYKLYIQMLRTYSIKNEYITNSINHYQQQIKKLFELIKKIINESNNIDINKLLNNTHFTNNPNIIIEDNLDYNTNKDELLKKQKYLDNIFNSLSDTLLEIKGGLSSDNNYDSGIVIIRKDLQVINKKLETEVLTNEQKDVLKKRIGELEKKINDHESKTNDEITKFIKENEKYIQENEKYIQYNNINKQENEKYKEENKKYKEENEKYKQDIDKYKQEILLETSSGTIRIENISDDDMKLIKEYFKECYDSKNYKIVLQKYLKFVDEKKKLLNMKKNEFIEKLDNLLFNTLGINVPLEDVFTNIFNDIEPDNLDESQIYVLYLDLDKNNFFDNNENVQENINYLLRLIKIFYLKNIDFDKMFNNDFICGLEKKITDYVKSKKTIEKYLFDKNIINNDKNYVSDLTTEEYAELQKLLNNKQFIDNYIGNKQIYIKPDDLIDLNDEFNNKFNNELKPIEFKSLFNNKYGIDIYNRKSELFYGIDPPNFDELTKFDEFENYLRRNFINYSNKLVVQRTTAEERRNSSEIILKEIIYNLKKNLIFQSFKYSIEIEGKLVNTKINDLQTRVSQKKINDTLCNIKNQIKKEEVKTLKSFEAMEKNKKYLKIDDTNTNNFDWNKWLNFYFDFDNSLKNTKQTKDISDTKDKLTKLEKALKEPSPENISNIDLSGFIINKCKFYTPYSKEPVNINLIEIKKDNLFVCSYSLLKYKTNSINIEIEKDTSEKIYEKIIDKPRPPSPFGLPSRPPSPFGLPSRPPSPFQQPNFLEQIKLKGKKTETETENQENPKSINNSFLGELKNIIGSKLNLRIPPKVGGDNNDYYKNKYFKYKNKYLQLKNKYL